MSAFAQLQARVKGLLHERSLPRIRSLFHCLVLPTVSSGGEGVLLPLCPHDLTHIVCCRGLGNFLLPCIIIKKKAHVQMAMLQQPQKRVLDKTCWLSGQHYSSGTPLPPPPPPCNDFLGTGRKAMGASVAESGCWLHARRVQPACVKTVIMLTS